MANHKDVEQLWARALLGKGSMTKVALISCQGLLS